MTPDARQEILMLATDASQGGAFEDFARQPFDPEALLTVEKAAAVLDLSVSTLNKMRCKGTGPRYCRLTSRAIRYRREDLNAYISTRLQHSTSHAA